MAKLILLAVVAALALMADVTAAEMSHMEFFKQIFTDAHADGATPREWLAEAGRKAQGIMGAKKQKFGAYHCDAQDPNKHCDLLPDLYWRWIPEYLTALPVSGASMNWTSPCFKSNTAYLKKGLFNFHTVHVHSSNPTAESCVDHYMFGTSEWNENHEVHAKPSEHTVDWTVTMPAATNKDHKTWQDREGVRVFRYLDERATTLEALTATLGLFVPEDTAGPHVVDTDRTFKFLKDYPHFLYSDRQDKIVYLPEASIADGTLLAIFRPDGLAGMQIWGTGQRTSHIALALRINGTLKIVESTDKTPYWDEPHIQMHDWSEWLQLAERCNYSVAVLPLKDTQQAQFSQGIEKAIQFIKGMLGHPYGYRNFIFGFIDTPNGNLPWPASYEAFEIYFNVVEVADKSIAELIWLQALSLRATGKWNSGMNTVQLANYAASKGMTFGELLSVPEQDSWVYSDGPSMVCDVFACSIYKAAGLFGNLASQINCGEFQNADVYTLNFFNVSRTLPEECQQLNPNLPYCQIEGSWHLPLPGVSTVTPYAHMNEKCSAQPPLYKRPPMC